jgi:hypothetical protein
LVNAGTLEATGSGGLIVDSAVDNSGVNLLIEPTAFTRLAAIRVTTKNAHGTACTLSVAIAAGLAKGSTLLLPSARPKTMSPQQSQPPSGLRSAPATGQCITFIPGGERALRLRVVRTPPGTPLRQSGYFVP